MTQTRKPGAGPGRFTPQLGPDAEPPGRARAVGAALALLLLVAGVPAVLLWLAPVGDLLSSLPGPTAIGEQVPVNQVLAVLVVVAWLAWLQFAVCVVVEAGAALRGGGLAVPVPFSGPSQRLARALVASVLVAGAVAVPASSALAAPRADVPPAAVPVAAAPVAVAPAHEAAGPVEAAALQSLAHAAAEESVAVRDDEKELDGHKVYVVRAPAGRHHDSLWAIAERHLGDGRRYPEIFSLNDGRHQPDGDRLELARLIRPGWRLIMPEDTVGVPRFHARQEPTTPDKPSPAPDRATPAPETPEPTSDAGPTNAPLTSTPQRSTAAPRPTTASPSRAPKRSTAASRPTTASPSSAPQRSTAAPDTLPNNPATGPLPPSRTTRPAPSATSSVEVTSSDPRVTAPPQTAPTARLTPRAAGATSSGVQSRTGTGATEPLRPPVAPGRTPTGPIPTTAGPTGSPTKAPAPRASSPTGWPSPTGAETTAAAVAAPGTGEKDDDGGPRDPETSWDMDGSRAELLLGGGMLTATLLGLLFLVRRRRGGRPPEQPAVEAEEFLRAGAPADRGELLDAMLKSIRGHCAAAGVALPPAYGAVADHEGIDLLMSMPTPGAPSPWRDVDGGGRWRLLATDRDLLEPTGESAYPLLASVGRDDEGRDVLLNLGAAGGPVTVLGSPAMAAAVVRAVALGLAGSTWSRGIEVLTCDLPQALPAIAAGRLTSCPSTEDLTDRLEQTSGRLLPSHGPAQVLTGGPPPGSRPERVAVYGATLSPGLGDRVGAVGGHGDIAVLMTGELSAARWRLRVDDTGHLECEELSLSVTAHRLGHGSIDRLHSLFVAAAQPAARPMTGDGRPASPPPQVETDDVAWAQATCRLALLGEVEVRAEGPLEASRTALAGEVVAYLSLHPAGVHPTVLGSALWPAGVPNDVLDGTLEQVRTWLGTDPDGRFRVRTGHDGRLRLSPSVVCDWDVLRTLLARARRAPAVSRERDLLVRALHLVRGPVAGGAPPVTGTYSWLARTGLERQASDLVVDAADRLSRICLEEGDQVGVAQASAAGLRAQPSAQQLWRNILRAEHALGGTPRLDVAVEHLRFALSTEGVDVEPQTQALIDHLRGTTAPRANGSTG